MTAAPFGDRLASAVAARSSQIVVGIDPDPASMWPGAGSLREHCLALLDAAAPACVAVKPQLAFFEIHGAEGFDAFLRGADILVSLLPLTPETRGLIDLPLLRKLRRDSPLGGPIVINAGRGGSHVEADIVAALRDGTLAGASLDVFQTEPLPADSPLWDLGNVVITPHVAAVSDPIALAGQIAGQIKAFERGEKLKNRVNPRRGY